MTQTAEHDFFEIAGRLLDHTLQGESAAQFFLDELAAWLEKTHDTRLHRDGEATIDGLMECASEFCDFMSGLYAAGIIVKNWRDHIRNAEEEITI